jgi:heat shock protein HslJ
MLKFLALTSIATTLTIATSPIASALTYEELQIKYWQVAEWQENGTPVTVLIQRGMGFSFEEKTITGLTGCGWYKAKYQLRGSHLSIAPFTNLNKDSCSTELKQQEAHLFSALRGAKNLSLNSQGRLVLSYQTRKTSGKITFHGRSSVSVDSLDKTNWQMVRIEHNGVSARPIQSIYVSFTDTKITGSSECNAYVANYRQQGNQMLVLDMSSTAVGCDPEKAKDNETHNAFLKIKTFTVDFQRNQLILNFPTGRLFYQQVIDGFE